MGDRPEVIGRREAQARKGAALKRCSEAKRKRDIAQAQEAIRTVGPMLTEGKGVTHEDKASDRTYCCGPASGSGSGLGTSRVCGRIRPEQADQGAGGGGEVGIDQSA